MSRKMVFNVVAHDQDDYTKNTFGSMSNVLPYSILYEHKLFTHNFRIPFLIRMVTVKAFAVPAKVPDSCRELFSKPTHPIRRKGETSFLMRFLFPMPPVLL